MKQKLFFSLLLLMFVLPYGATAAKPNDKKPQRIGIALGGGGALGYAHVGAIQALEDFGIHPQYVAGTSMGAIIGVFYAAGYSPKEILEIVKKNKLYRINKLLTLQSAVYSTGMSNHSSLISILHKMIPHNQFAKLDKYFVSCVTNLDKGTCEYIDKGGMLAEYVAASASIPGVFEPMEIKNTVYVDGGTLNNLPAEALKKRCDYIIGVDVLPFMQNKAKSNSFDVMLWSLRLVQHQNSKHGRSLCNFVVPSYALLEYHEFNFDKYIEIYQYGYKAMSDYLRTHPEVVKQLKSN